MVTDWNMPRGAAACVGCGLAFVPGDVYQAFLYSALPGYERRDYCLRCSPADLDRAVAHWQSRRPAQPTPRAAAFEREAVLSLFERLADSPALEHRQLRFVLALLLWRKKILKFVGIDESAQGETWEFRAADQAEPLLLDRPDLEEDELERLSLQLEHVLAGLDAHTFPESVHETR